MLLPTKTISGQLLKTHKAFKWQCLTKLKLKLKILADKHNGDDYAGIAFHLNSMRINN